MSNTAASISWFCCHCGDTVYGQSQHFCRQLQPPPDQGARELRPLTEADVRRIIREELAAAGKTQEGG